MPVPWDPEHVFYVWFDALLNYYTALSFARDGEDLTDTFWPADFHVIGKDILKFHAVFWPAMLLAADLPLPEHLFIHGFLLMKDASGEEHKMSKSLGNVLDPFEVMDQFGTDALRYYCFREVSFGLDGSVSTTTFGERYTSELANEYGNLASRTLNMIGRYCDGTRPHRRRRPRARAPTSTGLADEVVEPARPRGDHAGARADLAARAAAEPVRRGERAVEAGEGAAEQADVLEHDAALARRGAARADRAARSLHARDDRRSCSPRSATSGLDAERGRVRRGPGRRHDRRAAAAVPEATMIDSHTHLDHGPAPEDELVAAARAAGVNRILTIGMDSEGCRSALAAADRFEEVYAAVGRHPNSAEGFDDAAAAELAELAQHPRCRAIGETGPRLLPRPRAARGPGARVRGPDRARARRSASRS